MSFLSLFIPQWEALLVGIVLMLLGSLMFWAGLKAGLAGQGSRLRWWGLLVIIAGLLVIFGVSFLLNLAASVMASTTNMIVAGIVLIGLLILAVLLVPEKKKKRRKEGRKR